MASLAVAGPYFGLRFTQHAFTLHVHVYVYVYVRARVTKLERSNYYYSGLRFCREKKLCTVLQ